MRFTAVLVALFVAAARLGAQQPAEAGTIGILDAVRLGRQHAISAVAALSTAEAAAARVGQRRADLLPTINGAANATRQTLNLDEFGLNFPGVPVVTPDFNVYRLQLTARQTLFDPAALGRLRAARDNAMAAGFDARTAADYGGAIAALAYLRVLGADETVRARLEDSTIASSLTSQAHRLVDAGVSPAIDATRSDVSFAAVRSELEIARNQAGRARLDLLQALDLPSGATIQLSDSLVTPPITLPTDPDSAVAFAWSHRTEVMAEHARSEYQRRSLSAIRAENLPSVGVQGGYTESGRALSGLRGTYNIMLGISIPILDGFRRQTRAGEQNAIITVQELHERDVRRQVETDVRTSLLDLASATQQRALAADRVRLAESELSQAQQRFGQGVAGSVETTQAQGALAAARDAFIQSRLAFATARLAEYRALGLLDQVR